MVFSLVNLFELCYKNGIKTDRLYPTALLQQDVLEQRLVKKLTDVISFNNHINNIK